MLITAGSVGAQGVVAEFGRWRDARLPSGNAAPHLLRRREGLSCFNLCGASEKAMDPQMQGEGVTERDHYNGPHKGTGSERVSGDLDPSGGPPAEGPVAHRASVSPAIKGGDRGTCLLGLQCVRIGL